MPDPILTGARLSSAVVCSRQAYYQAVGAPADEIPEPKRKAWKRGRIVDRAIKTEIIDALRADGHRPRTEEPVPWGMGWEGHGDVYVPRERRMVEIVSLRYGDEGEPGARLVLPERKVKQVTAYTIKHPNAEAATVVVVDPMTGDREDFEIDPDYYRDEVTEAMRQVVTGVEVKAAPPRTCRHPHDAPAFYCAFVAHCFADWQRPPVDTIMGADRIARDLADATDAASEANREAKRLEAERDALRAELRPLLEAGEPAEVGGIEVVRKVSPRVSFAYSAARKAGAKLPPDLERFVTTGETERWYVKRTDPDSID